MFWLIFTVIATSVVYWFLIRPFKYWVERGVNHVQPTIFVKWVLGKKSFIEVVNEIYTMFANSRYSGFYVFTKPALLLQDPALIKNICVKNFDHFYNHTTMFPPENDSFWAQNLFGMTGSRWHDARSVMRSILTTSTMKSIVPSITQKSQNFVDYFSKKNEDIVTLEIQDNFLKLTNDVIAKTAFGVECDSFNNGNNEFYVLAKELARSSGYWNVFKLLGYNNVPILYKIFQVRFFSKIFCNFFSNLVQNIIDYQQKNGIKSENIINLLVKERKRKHKIDITDHFIATQAVTFLSPGVETVSGVMSFLSYELAVNPKVQQKLIQEIDNTLKFCNGEISYEAIQNMKYMNMVIHETLRKWPVNCITERVCTKPYTIKPQLPNEPTIHINKGECVFIPIYSFHRDERYFPNPEQFDPERFSDENKEKIPPFTYMPFGVGPRGCVGYRFGLLEIKILLVHIMSHFELVPVEKSKLQVTIRSDQLTLGAKGGFWLGLKRRQQLNQI